MKTEVGNKETMSTLRDLVKINNDRVQGYNKAIDQAKDNPELQILFKEKVRDSERFASELNEQVSKIGGDKTDNPTAPGEIYRGWMSVKDAFNPSDKTSILESCEFGEDAAVKAYETALKIKELDPNAKSRIEEQYRVIKESHDQIKAKRDASKDKDKK